MSKGRPWRGLLLLLLTLLAPPVRADWLSDVTGIYVEDGGIRFACARREAVADRLDAFPADARMVLAAQAEMLAALIRHAADEALRNAKPMPPHVRARLAPYFPPEILDTVLWTTRDDTRIALDRLVLSNGYVLAVTLDRVIVFRGETSAADVALWAHELVHVAQYRTMGLNGFAQAYFLTGGQGLEKQAYDWGEWVEKDMESRATSGQADGPQRYFAEQGWGAECVD